MASRFAGWPCMTTWFWVDFQPCGVAHHVGGKLGGEFAAVREAPEKLRRFAAVCQPHKAEVHLRGDLHVLEILARAGDEEIFALQRRAGKARGNLPQNLAVHRIGCFAMIAYLEVAPTNDNSCLATSIFVGKSILTLHIGIITF